MNLKEVIIFPLFFVFCFQFLFDKTLCVTLLDVVLYHQAPLYQQGYKYTL